jgi:hypothetical protein
MLCFCKLLAQRSVCNILATAGTKCDAPRAIVPTWPRLELDCHTGEQTRSLGTFWGLNMNSKWAKLAAAAALSLCTAAPALAGSVTQPGETVGLNTGAPLPPGWYAINTVDWGCRNTTPTHTCTGVTIPVVAWSTPWTFWGARVQLLAAWPAIEAGVQRSVSVNPNLNIPGTYFNGMYNPAVFGQLAWDLGYGWGISYLLGAYFDYNSPVAWSDTSLNQRLALSYTGNDWGITANVIYGNHMNSVVTDRGQISGCAVSLSVAPTGVVGCNPNFLNVDLTVGHSFGKWQVAWVGFGSWDVSEPILGYQKQSQFAMGGLLGYDFGPVILQGYVTTDVYEKNYNGKDVRGWARVIIPLNGVGAPFGPSAPATMVRGSR